MANGYAAGGITGNKTYHQVRDQFMPMDSESMGYAYGGGVGSMMQPKRGLVNEPGGYAGEDDRSIGERILDNGYFMRDERLAGPNDGSLDISNIIDMFSKGISLDEKVVPRDKDLTSVEEIFQEDTPLTEGIFGLSEGFTLSPITMLRRYLANKELKKEKEFADGGMAGDKTYHQVRDQFMPMDSESMGYAYGGGIGSMMQPRMNFAGGGGDFIGLNPNGPITIEDLTETDNNGNFLISAAEALPDQTGTINSAPSITNRGLRTIEGSLIDGDDPSSRYGVQQDFKSDRPFDRDFSSFDEARMGNSNQITDRNRGQIIERNPSAPFNRATINEIAGPSTIDRFSNSVGPVPNVEATYQDMIMNPEGFPNALQNLERFQDNRFEDFKEMPGINYKDAPIENLLNRRNNPAVGIIDKFRSQQNPDASLMNKTKNKLGDLFSSAKDGITSLGGRFKEGAGMVFSPLSALASMRNPLNPNAANYSRNLAEQLNALDGTTGTVTSGSTTFMSPEDIAAGNFGTKSGAMLVKDPNTGLDKYGPGSVLSGKNAISGFGTNDYLGQIDKYIDKMKQRAIKKDLSQFQTKKLADAIAERKRETDRVTAETAARESATADRARAANAAVYASADRQGFTDGRGGGFGSRSTGTNDAFSNNSGRGRTGYQDGGIVSLRR
jgi:hypothetical protein